MDLGISICPIDVTGSELHNSTADGIAFMGTSLIVQGTTIDGSGGNGIRCEGGTCAISDSRINGNQLIGISGSGTTLTVSRSSLTENRQGGISFGGGRYDITNNFVFRNGNDADATFGGIRLEAPDESSRVEHNTIVFNDMAVGLNPVKAGGLFCVNNAAPNNLIYNNFEGNNSQPNAQTGGNCNLSGSLVVNGNGTNEMHFVSPISAPVDYHIADAFSPAVNAGVVSNVSDDIDKDPRSDGLPDIGADEVVSDRARSRRPFLTNDPADDHCVGTRVRATIAPCAGSSRLSPSFRRSHPPM